jgi:hypothetical protein
MRHAAETLTARFKRSFCFGAALAFLTAMTTAPAAADDEYFYVVNTATKMMAEVLAHRTDVGSPVVPWPFYGGSSQQFFVWHTKSLGLFPDPDEGQWVLLKARHSGLCLKTNGYQSGAPIVQAECGGDASQMWRVRTIAMTPADCPSGRCFGGQRQILQNYYDKGKRCLDAANGKFPAPPLQGAGLQAWDCISKFSAANAVNQEWELINIKDWNAPGPVVH